MKKRTFKIIFLALILFTINNLQFSFVKFNSQFFPLQISQDKLNIINSLRNASFQGKLFEAVFSLVEDAAPYKEQFISLAKKISDSSKIKNAQNDEEKADYILQLLHDFLLKKYIENDPRLSVAFKYGHYNCVSSTLIFNMLCDYFKIKTSAVVVPKHIFSIVRINDRQFDSETTVRFGFNPGQNRNITDEFKRITGSVYVPLSRGKRENINNFELISYLYSQTGNYLGLQKMFTESLYQFVYSLLIFSVNKSGIEGLKVSYYELALKAQKSLDYFTSINLMRELAKLLPDDTAAQKASNHHYNNLIIELIKQENYNSVFEIIKKYKNERDLIDINSKIIPEVYIGYSNFLSKKNKYKEALEIIMLESKNFPILKDLIFIIYNNWIISLINKKDYSNALLIAREALKVDDKFIRQISIIYSNHITENINAGNLENAYRIAKEFLIKFPENIDSKNLFIQFIRFYTSNLIKNNKINQAISLIETEKKHITDKDYADLQEYILVVSCENYLKSGDFNLSVDFFIQASKEFKHSDRFKKLIKNYPVRLVTIAYQNKKLDEIIQLLSKIQAEMGYEYIKEARSLVYYFKGVYEYNEKRFAKALSYVKEGLNIDKNNYLIELLKSTILNIVNDLVRNNKIDEAIELTENACNISENNYEILNVFRNTILGIARYYIAENKKDLAINILKRGLKKLNGDREIEKLLNSILRG